jgi:hypothetical protein
MSLWSEFINNDKRMIHKWVHYFPIYEKHFAAYQNKNIVFFEIGLGLGGSIKMWKNYFGPLATIVGIDNRPECKAFEEPGINIRIGSQNDPQFLQTLIKEFGQVDIVLDDGSHMNSDQIETFRVLYPFVNKNGLYLVEDVHTSYWEEYGGAASNSFINYCKALIDILNADHSRGRTQPDLFTRQTFCMNFYDSVVVFEKGMIPEKVAILTGKPD